MRKPLVLVGLTLASVALVACQQNAVPVAARPASDATSTYAASAADDLRFFASLRPGEGVILKRQPPTLAAAYDEATATVLAEVKGVRKGRVLKDLQWVAVELRVIEVLSGNLRPELGKKVDVEFPVEFLPEPVDPVVDAMRSTLPKGPAVWLLQWEGSLATPTKPGAPSNPSVDLSMYVTVHPNTGVFIQGPQGVVAATAQEKHDGLSARGAEAEGQRFATVNELADHVRQNR